MFNGQSILITGGTGSFGHRFIKVFLDCGQLGKVAVKSVYILKFSEEKQNPDAFCIHLFLGYAWFFARLASKFRKVFCTVQYSNLLELVQPYVWFLKNVVKKIKDWLAITRWRMAFSKIYLQRSESKPNGRSYYIKKVKLRATPSSPSFRSKTVCTKQREVEEVVKECEGMNCGNVILSALRYKYFYTVKLFSKLYSPSIQFEDKVEKMRRQAWA